MGIAGAANPHDIRHFVIEHSITFPTLLDHPDLPVTSHYNIDNWSQYRLLDPHGNRISNQPALFTTQIAEHLLAQFLQPPHPVPRTWELRYLTNQEDATYAPVL